MFYKMAFLNKLLTPHKSVTKTTPIQCIHYRNPFISTGFTVVHWQIYFFYAITNLYRSRTLNLLVESMWDNRRTCLNSVHNVMDWLNNVCFADKSPVIKPISVLGRVSIIPVVPMSTLWTFRDMIIVNVFWLNGTILSYRKLFHHCYKCTRYEIYLRFWVPIVLQAKH